MSNYGIDHLVYVVNDLQQGMGWFEQKSGIAPAYGGKHETFGTHNALVGLGNDCYLELLAIDPENTSVAAPRWMGVDFINEPILSRWAIVSDRIDHHADLLQQINPEMGQLNSGMRKRTDGSILTWKLAMPLPTPIVEIVPFIIDWEQSTHPSRAVENACSIQSFSLGHPSPEKFDYLFSELGIHVNIQPSSSPFIKVELQTPNGLISL